MRPNEVRRGGLPGEQDEGPRRRRPGRADALRALPVPGLRAGAGPPADDGRAGRDGGGAPGGLGDTVLGSGRAGRDGAGPPGGGRHEGVEIRQTYLSIFT